MDTNETRDIPVPSAEQTRLRAELRAANDLLDRSFAASPLAAIQWSPDGLVQRWNASASRIFGWRADEAMGKNVISLLVPNIALEHVEAIVTALLRGEAANSRNLNITKDGRLITCQWYNAVLRDEHDQVIGVLSQTEDVTEQLASEQRALGLLEALPDPVVVYDTEDRVVYLNPSFERVFGWARDELLGKPVDFVPEGAAAQTSAAIKRVYAGEPQVMFDAPRYTKNRRLLDVQISATLTRRANGEPSGMIVTLRDVSEQKRLVAEREQLQQELLAAQTAALRELSTPLIPLAQGVVVMPLIGAIDSRRAQQVIEALLEGVTQHHAQIAILDITGVPLVDTQVAAAIMRAARAVKLLGAEVVLSGIRPEVAQTLVGLGLDLSGITTLSTLQSGIRYALKR